MVIPMQAASVNTSPAQARANEQLRNDIQNTIREAQTAAREAARSAQAEARSGGPVIRLGGSGSGGGVIVSPPDADFTRGMPPQIVDISVAFFVMCAVIAIGWPLARAFGKRIERKGEAGATNPQLGEQLPIRIGGFVPHAAGLWWSKANAAGQWSPPMGTSASPVPTGPLVIRPFDLPPLAPDGFRQTLQTAKINDLGDMV